MVREEDKRSSRAKISPGFAARLEQLRPEEKVRAILLLRTAAPHTPLKRRPGKVTRRQAVKKSRQSVAEVLPDIDRILKRHCGKRLKSQADALGSVPVLTTPAGIEALTISEYVKAILEDQKLFRVA
jgi:hypothetical protein